LYQNISILDHFGNIRNFLQRAFKIFWQSCKPIDKRMLRNNRANFWYQYIISIDSYFCHKLPKYHERYNFKIFRIFTVFFFWKPLKDDFIIILLSKPSSKRLNYGPYWQYWKIKFFSHNPVFLKKILEHVSCYFYS
jgi:hypothetical protein